MGRVVVVGVAVAIGAHAVVTGYGPGALVASLMIAFAFAPRAGRGPVGR